MNIKKALIVFIAIVVLTMLYMMTRLMIVGDMDAKDGAQSGAEPAAVTAMSDGDVTGMDFAAAEPAGADVFGLWP